MRKITLVIVSVVAVVTVTLLVFVGAVVGTIEWDGWAYRQITVIAQASDGSPIPGALITFRDRWYDLHPYALAQLTEEERQNWQSEHSASGTTETDGSFTFRGMFSAGGKRTMLWDNGRIWLSGFISIQAEGYHTLESGLSYLVGRSSISVRRYRRKPIVVRCSLTKKESHKNRLNRTTEDTPSVGG